jgi:branched-chain amino acid transport system substrate-binding protein
MAAEEPIGRILQNACSFRRDAKPTAPRSREFTQSGIAMPVGVRASGNARPSDGGNDMKRIFATLTVAGTLAAAAFGTASAQDDTAKIALVHGLSGSPLRGLFETDLDRLPAWPRIRHQRHDEIKGKKIELIEKDTQFKPDIARAALAEAYGDDEALIAVGGTSSGVTTAMLPVAEEYEKILLVEPAVADSLTGPDSNRYVFKTSRNSSMDMQAQALALGAR